MVSRFLPGAIRLGDRLLRPSVFLAAVALLFAAACTFEIHRNVNSPAGLKLLFSGDTHHYLDIAKDFAGGNFSMDYVAKRPHRQPLYPLLVAPVFRWGNGDPALLAAMSAIVIFAAFLLAYWRIFRRFRSRFVAAVVGVLFLIYPFVREQATDRLLSEPIHLVLLVGILFSALDWLENRRLWSLLLAFALAGLDYLDRANGLFVTASLLGALALHELCRPPAEIFADGGRRFRRSMVGYAAAILIFAAVSTPSWLPRWEYFHDPIHHGYLNNYLWVDSYEEGHVGQKYAIYSARDYFATHGFGDVVVRWAKGIWKCGVAIPFGAENRVPILYFLALTGLGVTARFGPRSCRVLAIFGGVQMLPLVWTNLSNPNVRIPLAAMLPCFLFFAAYGLAWLLQAAERNENIRRWIRRMDSDRERITAPR